MELGPSLQNQTKKELPIFAGRYAKVSPSFIVILNRIEEKQ